MPSDAIRQGIGDRMAATAMTIIPTRRGAPRKASREDIILVATTLFQERGYHQTSMQELAKLLGLQKGTLYHYFPDKEALLVAVLEQVTADIMAGMCQVAGDVQRTPRERLETVLECTTASLMSRRGCLVGNLVIETLRSTPSVRGVLQTFFRDWAHVLAELLITRLPASAARQVAEDYIYQVEGSTIHLQLYDDPAPLLRANAQLLARLA